MKPSSACVSVSPTIPRWASSATRMPVTPKRRMLQRLADSICPAASYHNSRTTMSELLLTGISQLVTPQGPGAKRGPAMRDLSIVHDAAIAIDAGIISWVGRPSDWTGHADNTIDLGNRAVIPGLIDPHTHAIWAGDRLADFESRSSCATYEQILASGGGIWHTIRET